MQSGHLFHGIGKIDVFAQAQERQRVSPANATEERGPAMALHYEPPAHDNWLVHVSLITLAGLLFLIDHKRRPPAVGK